MWLLTDGKYYVMENPYKSGEYLQTSYQDQAKEFEYNRAKRLLQNKKKSLAWIRKFHMLNQDSGEIDIKSKYYKGNGGNYIGNKDIYFDESIISQIQNESQSLMGIAAWDINQLKTYKEMLSNGLSKYDSAESDIGHSIQKYMDDNDGKNPQAHRMAKIGYIFGEIREKRKNIKQCLRYITIMENAIIHNYTLEKIKSELNDTTNVEYKGRTEYYNLALEVLGYGGTEDVM